MGATPAFENRSCWVDLISRPGIPERDQVHPLRSPPTLELGGDHERAPRGGPLLLSEPLRGCEPEDGTRRPLQQIERLDRPCAAIRKLRPRQPRAQRTLVQPTRQGLRESGRTREHQSRRVPPRVAKTERVTVRAEGPCERVRDHSRLDRIGVRVGKVPKCRVIVGQHFHVRLVEGRHSPLLGRAIELASDPPHDPVGIVVVEHRVDVGAHQTEPDERVPRAARQPTCGVRRADPGAL